MALQAETLPEGVAQMDGVALGCEGACVDDGLGVARDGFGLGLKLEPRPKPMLKMEPWACPLMPFALMKALCQFPLLKWPMPTSS